MFGLNFDKLKTNSALKAVYRVKHLFKWLKIKCRSSELQGLSCRNNIVTACCSSAGRATGVCPAFAPALMQRRAGALPATAQRPQQAVIWYKANVFGTVLARPACFWRFSGVYIYAFICVQYFKHTQSPLAITARTKICVALVQRPPRTSNECWQTTNA